MPTRLEIYHSKAQECERLAGKARDSATNHRLLKLAREWRAMAHQEETSVAPEWAVKASWRKD